MTVLGKSEILKLVKEYRSIHPFDERLLDGDSYILTVKDRVVLNYLEHQNLISREIVFPPSNFVAHLTAKSKFGRDGLSFLNAAKVHSGIIGRLALEVVNLNNERKPIVIEAGEPFMHMEFVERIGDPSPYVGEYQFQYMTREEIEMYLPVLQKAFPNLQELRKVWKLDERLGHSK
jgi:dCTP deaminase